MLNSEGNILILYICIISSGIAAFYKFPLVCTTEQYILLYSVVSNYKECSKHFTFYTSWQTCSIEHDLDFSGKNSAMLQLINIGITVW